MTVEFTEEELYKIARQRLQDKKDFLKHLIAYAIVNITLVLAWALSTDAGHPWFIWVLIPWGIGVFIHFSMVIVSSSRNKKIKEESNKPENRKKGFYRHLGIYLIVNIILIIVWTQTKAESDTGPWFVYPLVSWGVFVTWNYLEAFVLTEETGWEKRQVEKEVEKLKKAQV